MRPPGYCSDLTFVLGEESCPALHANSMQFIAAEYSQVLGGLGVRHSRPTDTQRKRVTDSIEIQTTGFTEFHCKLQNTEIFLKCQM